MNILILNWKDTRNPSSGGAEIVTHEHAKRWAKAGHKVVWLCSKFGDMKKEESYDGIEFHRFGNIYTIYFFAPIFYLFSGKKFDVVLDEVHGIPFFTPLYCRKPILVLIHEIAGEIWNLTYPFPLNYVGRFLEMLYLRQYRNRKFWTDAQSTVEDLVRHGIKKENCVAIPCPSNARPLDKIPVKNENLTLVSVSRIVKMKGIEDVIDAFSLIHQKINKAELWVLGDGDPAYVKTLKSRKIADLHLTKQIKFFGFVSEKEKLELIRKAHLLLHASVKEGWGLVVIEAASQATPSVVYNVEGLRDSVKNGNTGIVVSNNKPEELAIQAIELFDDKNRYEMFQKNGLRWASELTWDSVAKQSLKMLQSI